MPEKLTFEYVKKIINEENELISKEYVNNRELLEILCKKCNKIFLQCFGNYNRGCRCRSCYMSENGKKGGKIRYGTRIPVCDMLLICIYCKSEFSPTLSKQKLCNKACALNYSKTDFYRNRSKINGSKGGILSAVSQQRRSKNEIICADLCIDYFGKEDVQCNELIFKDTKDRLWDCDIFIKSLKIAILWDGYYYHYGPKVSNHQKSRDMLKRKIILDNGCEYYTIIDKGGVNEKFVKEQFGLFIHKLLFKKVMSEICEAK